MKIIKLKNFKKNKCFSRIMGRSQSNYTGIMPVVNEIMEKVKENGDQAVFEYTAKFDKVKLKNLKVSTEEINLAYKQVSKKFLVALNLAIKNITIVHKKQLEKLDGQNTESVSGVKVWKNWRPIEKVGLYVPGGKTIYPSSVLMNAIPAKIAGCKQIILCSPPQSDGNISPYVLVAADKLGIKNIFKIGGAQAVAAMAYGTETVPKVYKVTGPGNAYVTSAKLAGFVSGDIAIDSPAGPSEVFIIADETANPKFIASDLICDAEHGEDSAVVLVTTSVDLAKKVIKEINNILPRISTREYVKKSIEQYGLFAVADTMDEAVDFANDYAPEHIQIMTKNADQIAKQINNAGSIFVGNYTCKSAGDYATGANHVLPTGGAAKMFGGLSVFDFVRLVEFQKINKEGLNSIKQAIETFAEIENLPGHKYSCQVRFE